MKSSSSCLIGGVNNRVRVIKLLELLGFGGGLDPTTEARVCAPCRMFSRLENDARQEYHRVLIVSTHHWPARAFCRHKKHCTVSTACTPHPYVGMNAKHFRCGFPRQKWWHTGGQAHQQRGSATARGAACRSGDTPLRQWQACTPTQQIEKSNHGFARDSAARRHRRPWEGTEEAAARH